MHEPETSPQNDESQETSISHTDVGSIHADVVRMHQADAESINANQVDMMQSAAGNVKGTRVSARQSAMATVDAADVLAEHSALGFVQAENATVRGFTGAIGARHAEIHHAATGVVFGETVHVSDSSRTVLLIGETIHGNVTTLMDTRMALIAGLVGGLSAGIMLLCGRMLSRRR